MRRLLILALVLLASCGGERVEETPTPAPAAPSTSSASSASSTSSPSSTSSQLSSIQEEPDGTVLIAFTEAGAARSLVGDKRETGKRKYRLSQGPVAYEIKPDTDSEGFKLRTADGKLRWKVKVSPEKIKISDNEENKNPFELKVRDGGRFKVVAPGDRELGNVRFETSRVDVENAGGTVVFTKEGAKPGGAYGVLLLDGIPVQERYILIAELLSRGK